MFDQEGKSKILKDTFLEVVILHKNNLMKISKKKLRIDYQK